MRVVNTPRKRLSRRSGRVASLAVTTAMVAGVFAYGTVPATASPSCPTGSVPGTFSGSAGCQVDFLVGGSWTVPTDVAWVDVVVVGAGGGGGGAARITNGSGAAGGGGGGGQVVVTTGVPVSASTSVTITVGTGGGGGTGLNGPGTATAGQTGGASSFGSITAQGGTGGEPGTAAAPSATGGEGGDAGAVVSGTRTFVGGSAGASITDATYQVQVAGAGGGAGAGENGNSPASTTANGGWGGNGVKPTAGLFSGNTIYYGGGGGGGQSNTAYPITGIGGLGGSTVDGSDQRAGLGGNAGTAEAGGQNTNTGGGGGGAGPQSWNTSSSDSGAVARLNGGAGDGGRVIIRWLLPAAPILTAKTPGGGTVGTPYSYTFVASGSPAASITSSGSLPPGLSLSNGVLAGTPTTAGVYSFTVTAANGITPDDSASVSITIDAPPTFTEKSPPSGTVGNAYTYTFVVTGSPTPTIGNPVGTLPPGLTWAGLTLSGTPTTAGLYSFTLTATNGVAPDATASVTIVVSEPGSGGAPADPTPTASPSATPVAKPTPAQPTPANPLDPISSPQNPAIPSGGLPAGDARLLSNGQSVPLTVTPNAQADPVALVVSAPGLKPPLNMRLEGRGDDADPLGLTSKQALVLQSQQIKQPRSRSLGSVKVEPVARSSGDGFKATSPVRFYLLPNTYLGNLTTDVNGEYRGDVPIPPGITPGVYTLQVNGYAPDDSVRSLSIGVLVKPTVASQKVYTSSTQVFFASMDPRLDAEASATLRALVRKTGKSGIKVRVVGYVQPTSVSSNDQSLSSARARDVAAFLRDLGLRGSYSVRGDGKAMQTGATARRVNVTVTYTK